MILYKVVVASQKSFSVLILLFIIKGKIYILFASLASFVQILIETNLLLCFFFWISFVFLFIVKCDMVKCHVKLIGLIWKIITKKTWMECSWKSWEGAHITTSHTAHRLLLSPVCLSPFNDSAIYLIVCDFFFYF